VFVQSAFSQEDEITTTRQTSNTDADLSASSEDASRSIMLARSSADYRVTPGDVYTLAYAAGSTPVSYVITVDTSYRIRVSNLGMVNGAGKTFMQLKTEVEAVVTNNYPLSGVQLVLTQPAVFKVFVNGEVHRAGEVSAWGLSRLSTLAGGNFTGYTSTRDISVKSSNGQTRVYDLFKAHRFGDMDQNPYLRPGDVVTFNRIKRVVSINGAVERPGRYQLLDGENIKELIEIYANGFTPLADITRVEMTRVVNSVEIAGDKIFFSNDDLSDNYALEHLDSIYIPSVIQLRSILFVEGAVGIDISASLQTTNQFRIQFASGETYASLIKKNIAWFSAVSDTQNSYIMRKGERIDININEILYNISYRDEIVIEDEDTLIIPFRQYFVAVSGSVRSPGRYPYIPERDWEYYIGLAGGFVPGQNAKEAVTIRDIYGKKMKKTDEILPETNITAETNHFLYFFNQYAPLITTVLSVVTTFFTVMAVTR
jgi:protein involved in polysaccharide export with SLBB domain